MGHESSIKNPGKYEISGGTKGLFLLFAAIGVAAFGFALKMQPNRAWSSFVLNHFYFMSLGLGGLFFASIQWLTGAMWSAPIRRLSEAFTAYLPFVLVTLLVLIVGIPQIYIWSHPELVRGDIVLEGKAGYLSTTFFTIRNFVAVFVWLFFSWKLVSSSIAQDSTGDYRISLRNRAWAPAFLVLFGISFTLSSFDQLMSLDPHWFSTMFGVYCFAGLFYSNLAATCLLVLFMKSKGKLDGIMNENHLHDLGKFMLAFTIFWAYIGFSQFMLIWYANLPEETGYFIHRFHGNWFWVTVFLLVGKFLIPFFALLPRDSKRNPRILAPVAVFMLIAQWIDMMWIVQPEFFAEGPQFGLTEIGVTLGFVGVFGLLVSRFLSKHNVVAIGDPRLPEAVFHHHQ